MAHHAITYHEENKTTACFDMEAMRMLSKQSFSFLSFVIQQQRDAGPGDFPVLHRVFRYSCIIPVKKISKSYSNKIFLSRLSATCSSNGKHLSTMRDCQSIVYIKVTYSYKHTDDCWFIAVSKDKFNGRKIYTWYAEYILYIYITRVPRCGHHWSMCDASLPHFLLG